MPGMIDVVSRRCEWKLGCTKRPLYGFPGERPKVCARHKTEGMVDRKSRHCAVSHCMTVPSYYFPGGKAQFCQKHASPGMVNVVSSQYIFPGCKTRASFAMHRGSKAILCAIHKEGSMVDVRSRQCSEEGCRHQPSFAEIGSRPTYCSLHKRSGMIDVKNRGVKRSDCDVQRNESQPRRKARDRKYQQASTQCNLETHMCSEAPQNQDYMFVNTLPIVEKLELAVQHPTNSSVVPEITTSNLIPNMMHSYDLFQGIIHCGFDQGDTGSNVNIEQNGYHKLVKHYSSPTNLQGGAQWQNQKFPSDLPLMTNLIPSEDTAIPEYTCDNKGSDTQSNSLQSYETVGSPPLLSPTSLTTSASWETVVESPGSTLVSPCTELQYLDYDCLNYNRACACMHCNSLASKSSWPECRNTV